MNQLAADLRRFFARRLVRGTIVVAVLIAALSIGIVTVRGHRGSGVSFGPTTAQPAPIAEPVPTASLPPGAVPPPGPGGQGQFTYEARPDTRIDVGRSLHATLEGLAVLMVFVGAVLGASFVGAEFNIGSLTSQLLYEPRRWRVHLAKTAAVALGVAVVAALICLVTAGLMLAGSEAHGIVNGLDSAWWRHRGIDLSRALAAGSSAAVMAYAVTIVLRRTSATIVAFLAQYPFVLIVGASTKVFGVFSRYAPMRGLLAISADPRGEHGVFFTLHTNAGVIVFIAVWSAVLVIGSGLAFSRAEVR